MNELNKLPKGTLKIILLTIFIPLLLNTSQNINKYLALRLNWRLPFNLFINLFRSGLDVNLIVNTLMRLQTLSSLENSGVSEHELLGYTLFGCPMFLLSFYLEGVTSFSGSLSLMYTYYLSKISDYFNIFGVIVKANYLPIINLGLEFLTSKGMTKSYYGYINGVLYFYLKSKGVRMPYWIYNSYCNLCKGFKNPFKPNKSIRLKDARKMRKEKKLN
ncbi:hypothetical protein TUBRATIS_002760 [Tubulinosema ratisbonensis]|uniref:Derlin n=1 Tax=Tubulinosema ratisbonensis TaxID=291195 RepID=A0A437AQ19_9MICR|nr:hypothetical protein TUBRATIS_002760 [Tubulinosema ratisbonensis]